MSSTIDERIVAMKFNNAQFQKNAKDTLGTLGDLKKNLNMDGAKKGLEALGQVAGKFNLNSIGESVDQINKKFSALGVIGATALAMVTASAVRFAQSMAQNVFGSIRDGFNEYETNMNSIQTILANTSSKGTSLDQVNAALEQLNKYSDKTIYNFSEMAKNIGTFTAAGVDLDTSVGAIKGIANLAALSGSSSMQASTAMYQLSQAIASGTVKLMDWNSVQNAGMGGEIFQESLKETARVHGVNIDAIIAKQGSFRDSLQEGWLTTEILTETLAKFTGDLSDEQLRAMGYTDEQIVKIQQLAATALGAAQDIKTFSQLMSTIAETSASGWAKTWQIIFGDFEEAKALWTEINGIIGPMQEASAKARNDFLQAWADGGGRATAIEALRNVFLALMSVLNPIGEAFREVFPPGGPALILKIGEAIRDFTAKLILSEEAQARVKAVATAFFTVLKFGGGIIGALLGYLGATIGLVVRLGVAFASWITPVIDFFIKLGDGSEESSNKIADLIWMMTDLRERVMTPIIATIRLLGDAFDELINGDYTQFGTKVKAAFEPLVELGKQIAKNWEGVSKFFQMVWEKAQPAIKVLKDLFKAIKDGVAEVFAGADINTVLAGINTGFLALIVLSIKKYLDTASGFIDSFVGAIDGLTGVLKAMQMDLKAQALIKIAIAIGILAAALLVLTMINPANIGSAIAAMAAIVTALVAAMIALDKFTEAKGIVKLPVIAATMILLAAALLILAVAMKMMAGLSWEEIAKGLGSIAVAMLLLVGAVKVMGDSGDNIAKAAGAMILMGVAILLIAASMKVFASMSWEDLAKGAAALVLIVGLLTGALLLLSARAEGVQAAATAILLISIAIGVLAAALAFMGLLPFPVLIQGLVAVGILLAMLAGAILLLSMNNAATMAAAAALLAIAIAVGVLTVAVAMLGSMSIETLVQGLIGLAATLAILVVAMSFMTTALPGAAATIVVAAAILVLTIALMMLGSMSIESLVTALIALVAVFVILAAAGLLLGPLTPILIGLGAAIALVGLGMILMAAAGMILVLALGMFGPAAAAAAEGIATLSAAVIEATAAFPAFLLLGVGLLAFGVGALAAGAGILVLAAALLLLGIALTLIGATGIIGATALTAVINSLLKLMPKVLEMAAMGAGFAALGAGMTVLGVGALAAGAGLLLVGSGMMLVATASVIGAAGLTKMGSAVEKASTKTGAMTSLGNAIEKLGNKAKTAGTASSSASTGIEKLGTATTKAATGATKLTTTVTTMGTSITLSASLTGASFSKMSSTMVTDMSKMTTASSAMGTSVTTSMRGMSTGVTSSLNSVAAAIRGASGGMSAAGSSVGAAIAQGMANGLNNNSSLVTAAAKKVAANALAASKKTLGVASPSKRYFEIGEWSDEGLADGFKHGAGMVARASAGVGTVALQAIKKSISGISKVVDSSMDVNPVISPVLDLSGFKKEAALLPGMLGQTIDVGAVYANASAIETQRRTQQQETIESEEASETVTKIVEVNYEQNITSPKAVSTAEVYRNTKNGLSIVKGVLENAK